MTSTPHRRKINLQEVNIRNQSARQVIADLAPDTPAETLRCVERALADLAALADEIVRLRTELDKTRLERANLAAAALAAISAIRDGEPYGLLYLADELTAQGYDLARRL